MKKTLYFLSALLLIACGKSSETSLETILASNDLESIRNKKSELTSKQQALDEQITQLSKAIAKLDPSLKIPLVTSLTVASTKFDHYIELQGNVETKENLTLTPEYNGILENIYVKEGQYVRKGQLLAKIDDGGLSEQLAQLEIQAELAKTTFERQERLWNQKIGSEIQYLQAKTSYEANIKGIDQLKKNISKSKITAPFSGIIDAIITEKGNVVAAGQSPILRIVNLSNMYVEANVPERYVGNVTKGTTAKVSLPVLGKDISTEVRLAENFINPADRTYKIEVPVPNKEKLVKPNLTAKLYLNDYTNDNAILIPQSLISENTEEQQYVYKIEKQGDKLIAIQQIIETGKVQGDLIEITKGLSNNTEIVEEGARSVKNNQEIKLLN